MSEAWNLDEGFRVGDWEVLPRHGTLSRADALIHPEPKVMDVLTCLARHRGDVVTRDQFAEEVWAPSIVSDEVLTRAISVLRTSLGDNPKEPHYIQTIPRRGYRLVAEVTPIPKKMPASIDTPVPPPEQEDGRVTTAEVSAASPPSQMRVLMAVAGLVLVAVIGFEWWRHTPSPTASSAPPQPLDNNTIAVLPFETAAGDIEVFGYGLADEIRVSLNTLPALRIVPGMSVQSFKAPLKNPRAIGEKLNAGSLLIGNVREDGNRLKITAQLIDANTGLQRWSDSYEEPQRADIFKVQSDISRAIAEQLALKLDPNLERPPTTDQLAYTEFLQARHMLRRRGTEPIRRSIVLFNQAIERDPQFGRAYVGLAEALIVAPSYTDDPEEPMYERATSALDRADRLGASQPPAPAIRAFIETRRWRWFDAAKEFDIALASDPNGSDLRQYYSQFLAYTGDLERATEEARRATVLDPLSPVAHQRLGVMYLWVNDNLRADQEFDLADKLGLADEANPEATVALLLWTNQFEQARARLIAIQRARHKSDAWITPVVNAIARQGPEAKGLAALTSAYASGQINARLYLGAQLLIGNPESFFAAIEDAVQRHVPFDVEIMFMQRGSALRSQPRFAALMQQIGLVAYWDANRWPPACSRSGATVTCR